MAVTTEFISNPAAIDALFNSQDGRVAQVLGEIALRVETQAKINATGQPVAGARNPEGRGPRVRTGNLRSSITWVYGRDQIGLFVAIGTNVFYGYYLEVELMNGFNYPFLRPALSAV